LVGLSLLGCEQQRQQQQQVVVKASQFEAKTNLMTIFSSEMAFFAENSTYGANFDDLGFSLLGDARYAYFLPGSELQPAKGARYSLPEGIAPRVDERGFVVVAVGNLDSDPTLDVWTMDQDRDLVNVVNDMVK
jgi:hypothetical protein